MWIRYLSSVKLTVVLLILIVVASIVGTLIPQDWTDTQYRARYGDILYWLLRIWQLTDVYHSYWYTALLTVFCVNLIVCSTQNFGPLVKSLRRSSSAAGRVKLADLPFYRKINLSAGTEGLAGSGEVIQQIKNILARSFYRSKYADTDRGIYYFERGKMGRLGPIITHASIVIILIGGIFVGRFGFKEYRDVPVGKTVDVPHSNFQVRADDFKAEFYPDSRTPKEYTSVLTIVEDGVDRRTETIKVNHPMKYKGVKFYQSSYGMADNVQIELSKKVPGETDAEVLGKFSINVGETFEVPDSQLKIKAVVMFPDFVADNSGRVGSRSRDPRNPAVLLELYEGDVLKDRPWIFQKYPDFHGSGESDYSLKFLSIGYYTGLQISYDPGLPVIWIGCLVMIVGMFLSFYLSYKRVWIRLSLDKGKTVMEVGGRSYKNRSGFEKEFGRLKDLFR